MLCCCCCLHLERLKTVFCSVYGCMFLHWLSYLISFALFKYCLINFYTSDVSNRSSSHACLTYIALFVPQAKSVQEKLAEAILKESQCSSEPELSDTSTEEEEESTDKGPEQDNKGTRISFSFKISMRQLVN